MFNLKKIERLEEINSDLKLQKKAYEQRLKENETEKNEREFKHIPEVPKKFYCANCSNSGYNNKKYKTFKIFDGYCKKWNEVHICEKCLNS